MAVQQNKVPIQARYAPLAQCVEHARYRSGAHHRRSASASPHQPHRLLPWSKPKALKLDFQVFDKGPHLCGPLLCIIP